MASPSTSSPATSTTHPYQFQRASTIATRQLVSDPTQQPNETTSNSSSHVDIHNTPAPSAEPSSNYQQAAAALSKAQSTIPGTTDKPVLGRQQSWDMRDMKREQTEKMLSGELSKQGYTSTQK